MVGPFVLDASGTPTAPLGSGHVTLGGLTFEGSPMPAVALDIVSDGAVLRLTTTEPAGLLTGECRIGGEWPVRLDLDLAAFPSAPRDARASLQPVSGVFPRHLG